MNRRSQRTGKAENKHIAYSAVTMMSRALCQSAVLATFA